MIPAALETIALSEVPVKPATQFPERLWKKHDRALTNDHLTSHHQPPRPPDFRKAPAGRHASTVL
jgi:hypothetical protein